MYKMIPEFILTLSMVLSLGTGDYEERKLNNHNLLTSKVSYRQLYLVKDFIVDPEVKIRLREVAYYKWCIETDGKYRDVDYYGSSGTVNGKLQDKDFKEEWKK